MELRGPAVGKAFPPIGLFTGNVWGGVCLLFSLLISVPALCQTALSSWVDSLCNYALRLSTQLGLLWGPTAPMESYMDQLEAWFSPCGPLIGWAESKPCSMSVVSASRWRLTFLQICICLFRLGQWTNVLALNPKTWDYVQERSEIFSVMQIKLSTEGGMKSGTLEQYPGEGCQGLGSIYWPFRVKAQQKFLQLCKTLHMLGSGRNHSNSHYH